MKDGREHFLKEFLAPTYPTVESPGSEKTKNAKRKECEAFEAHHRLLIAKLSARSSVGGNLIVTTDFFRAGAKYYKVTDKVDVSTLTTAEIASLPWDNQKLILLTVAHSLRILHLENVVHGDLKPDNILIKQTSAGDFVAKLIDFDNSYISGQPVMGSEMVGDQVYYSPEALLYIKQSPLVKADNLQLGSDIFALGIIYVEYLTGHLPSFDTDKYQYAAEAVIDGSKLEVPDLGEQLSNLFTRMLHTDYRQRPPIQEVFETIKSASVGSPTAVQLGGTLMMKQAAATSNGGGLSGTLVKRTS